jgi:hypothetical protein
VPKQGQTLTNRGDRDSRHYLDFVWEAMGDFPGMARKPVNLRSDSQFANFRLGLSALGDSQNEEKASNFWSGCHEEETSSFWNSSHFGIVDFVSVMVAVPVELRDLIVNDLEFCS